MNAYMLQAALICDHCAAEFMANTPRPSHVIEFAPGDYDESSYDSDEWPKGPYANGGGEADCPQHCDHCGEFLDNPLTGDGETYVREAWLHYIYAGRGNFETLEIWRQNYVYMWGLIADSLTDDNYDPTVTGEALQRFKELSPG